MRPEKYKHGLNSWTWFLGTFGLLFFFRTLLDECLFSLVLPRTVLILATSLLFTDFSFLGQGLFSGFGFWSGVQVAVELKDQRTNSCTNEPDNKVENYLKIDPELKSGLGRIRRKFHKSFKNN